MVLALLRIRDIEDRNLLSGYVAMFLGDFQLAQDLFLSSSLPMAALNVNKAFLSCSHVLSLIAMLLDAT